MLNINNVIFSGMFIAMQVYNITQLDRDFMPIKEKKKRQAEI